MKPNAIPAVVGLGVRRVVGRLTGPTPGRTVVCLLGVALAIAVLVVVTGLSLGLAEGATVASDDVDYWIVPEGDETGLTPLEHGGTQLGEVHDVATTITEDTRVDHATPVAIQPLRLEGPDRDLYVLALGIVPSTGDLTVADIETGALDETYPYYADGRYDGRWTGELVVSPAVGDQLGVAVGDELTAGAADRPLRVVDIADDDPTVGVGETPAVVMHLAELQTLTGTVEGDLADQILVDARGRDVESDLEGVYPQTTVETRSGPFEVSATPSNLPFAMAVASALTALGIGVAFVATMMGLELTATRQHFAVIDALGFSRGSVTLLLVTETVTLALLGGLLGVALGTVGIAGINAGVAGFVDVPPVATFDPLLVGYGLVAAVVVGVVSVVYPLFIAWRTDTLGELSR